ncbi:leucine-rich repeat domain-containing protein [Microscilla marina]|uniref:Leucine-rich repeat containing protein n=1 Tax=Microscilla marina ATCC 23134 TaxID=313606 RepID=A1ZJI6_MICM2|nr:leucine-rich repeat containing protein [Microscilla marina]EAY29289.1 leucine-rich repeat containing protein [Microscilla marina ATCC 23134]
MTDQAKQKLQVAFEQELPSLDLSNCALTSMPVMLSEMPWLTKLNLSKNPFTNLDLTPFSCLPNMEVLYLESLQLNSFPETLQLLTKLKNLHLANNNIVKLDEMIDKLPNLTKLRNGVKINFYSLIKYFVARRGTAISSGY